MMDLSSFVSFVSNPGKIDFIYRDNRYIQPLFHSHAHYEVYYFHGGKCNYLIGDTIYALAPGDLILMNGMTLHCAKIDPEFEYVRTIVHFEPTGLHPFLEAMHALNILQPFQELGNLVISFRGQEKEEVERILQHMQTLYNGGDEIGYNRFRLAFVDLLYVIYGHCRKPLLVKNELPSEKEKTVQRVISFVEQHYTEELDLEQIQASLHVSKYYLSKIFKEVTGVTIFDFVYQRRINQAKILFMLHNKLSVTEVSYEVGFKHLAHFSRAFKRQVGFSPDKYKKSMLAQS
jgi:AraC-like DNA-binding protein